jgi:hypothetical protein
MQKKPERDPNYSLDQDFVLTNTLLNTLIQIRNKNKNKNKTHDSTSLRLNREIREAFYQTCHKLGLASYGRGANLIVEAFMEFFTEQLKDHPQIVQTTLLYKPTFVQNNVKIENIGVKLQVKIVKKTLTFILQKLESKDVEEQVKEFQLSRLREVLPKAISAYEKTANKELEALLQKAEAYV